MRKVTVITLITTLLLLVVPGLSGCSSKPTSGNATSQEYTRSVVVPDHMWTMSMTEEQLDSLKNCWGSEMTILELTDLLWPEIVNFIPDHMVNHWSDKELKWSNTKLPNISVELGPPPSLLCQKSGIPHEEGYWMYALYIGCTEAETNSMMIEDFLNCTSENCYRVSLYMNNIFNEEGGNVAIE